MHFHNATRTHVGKHILKEHLGDVCGFCGMVGCSIDLIKGSCRGSSVTLTAGSNCSYKCKFSLKAAEKPTKSGPCTNRPIRCYICAVVKWSYSLPKHFRDMHTDHPVLNLISELNKDLCKYS